MAVIAAKKAKPRTARQAASRPTPLRLYNVNSPYYVLITLDQSLAQRVESDSAHAWKSQHIASRSEWSDLWRRREIPGIRFSARLSRRSGTGAVGSPFEREARAQAAADMYSADMEGRMWRVAIEVPGNWKQAEEEPPTYEDIIGMS